MKKIYLILGVFLVAVLSLGFTLTAWATTPTLSMSSTSSNTVSIKVSGDANSSVYLYYNLAYGSQSVYLGTTNSSGNLSVSLNHDSYGITSGALVYVTVNGQQSASRPWPSYYYNDYNYNNNYNSRYYSGVTVSTLNLPIGGSAVLNSASGQNIYVSSNSNSGVVSTSTGNNILPAGCTGGQYSYISGQSCYNNYYNYNYNESSSIQVNALSTGTSTINICSRDTSNYYYGGGCTSFTVNVTGVVPQVYNPNYNQGSVLGACYFGTILRYGISGGDVSCLQSTLQSLGYLQGNYASSYFDNTTLNAVIAFQMSRGLYPDGIVGKNTRNQLFGYR